MTEREERTGPPTHNTIGICAAPFFLFLPYSSRDYRLGPFVNIFGQQVRYLRPLLHNQSTRLDDKP